MDRGACQATVHAAASVGHNVVSWVFLCLFILFKLLSLGCPFCILAVCGVLFIVAFPRYVWVCTGGLSRFPG